MAVGERKVGSAIVPIAGTVDPFVLRPIIAKRKDVERAAVAVFGIYEGKYPGGMLQRTIFGSNVRRDGNKIIGTV